MSPNDPVSIRTFYRIVWTDPPTLDDFLSHLERGVELRNLRPETARLHSGVSMYRTLSLARKRAKKRPPWMGSGYIARVTIPLGDDIGVERTTRSEGHYTVCCEASRLLSWVDDVVPVSPEEGSGNDL